MVPAGAGTQIRYHCPVENSFRNLSELGCFPFPENQFHVLIQPWNTGQRTGTATQTLAPGFFWRRRREDLDGHCNDLPVRHPYLLVEFNRLAANDAMHDLVHCLPPLRSRKF